jgi:hypothetical protein
MSGAGRSSTTPIASTRRGSWLAPSSPPAPRSSSRSTPRTASIAGRFRCRPNPGAGGCRGVHRRTYLGLARLCQERHSGERNHDQDRTLRARAARARRVRRRGALRARPRHADRRHGAERRHVRQYLVRWVERHAAHREGNARSERAIARPFLRRGTGGICFQRGPLRARRRSAGEGHSARRRPARRPAPRQRWRASARGRDAGRTVAGFGRDAAGRNAAHVVPTLRRRGAARRTARANDSLDFVLPKEAEFTLHGATLKGPLQLEFRGGVLEVSTPWGEGGALAFGGRQRRVGWFDAEHG